MKKILSIVLVSALLAMLCAPFAVSAAPKSFNVPKAATVPTLDGVINADEWANALTVEMKKGDSNLFAGAGDLDYFGKAVFKFMWTGEGIWFAVTSTGNNEPTAVPAAGGGSYNSGNGVQFNMYANRSLSGTTLGELFFFSYHPKTDDGKPYVGEHFTYGTGGAGENVPEAKIAVVMNGHDYTMEGLIPAAGLAKADQAIKIAVGEKIYWNNVIMFSDDTGAQGLAVDNEWFNGEFCNEYVLVDTLAGIVPGGGGSAAPSGKNPFARMTATEDNVAGGPNGSHETKENPDALYDASKLFQLYWDTNSDYWAHGGVNTIAFLDPYGIGYGHERGVVYIENLDFGANGADKVTVKLTNTTEPFGGLGIYIDANPIKDANAKPLAVIKDVLTDGYEDVNALDYTVDINIPGGVHTVYFMYLGPDVGSFFSVVFNEAPPPPPPPAGEQPAPEQPAPTPAEPETAAPAAPAAPAPAAPPTGDSAILAFAALVLALAAAVVLMRKRLHN